jgi:hypothetical protein
VVHFVAPAGVASSDRVDRAIEAAAALAGAGRLVEAVDELAAVRRAAPDPLLDLALIDLRLEAGAQLPSGAARWPWPPRQADPFPDVDGAVPEVDARELTAEILGGAVAHHGCLIVRDVFDDDQVAQAVEVIDRADARRSAEAAPDETAGSAADAWYRPVATGTPMATAVERAMVGRQGGTWLADSPTATARILDQLTDVGVVEAIGTHLGERPYISLQKSTLRLSPPAWNYVAWHQDGSFLDADVRTMNVWVALTPCGGDLPTPGMEIIPRRVDEILEIDPAWSKHAIPFELMDEVMAKTPSVIPEFGPGDGMLFDERCVHRTHLPEVLTDPRYALECWFFAPSHHSSNYTPVLV